MRLHTNHHTADTIHQALRAEQAAGRIAPQVYFKILSTHGSRSHARAFEVQLSADYAVKGDGRRVGNSGSYGAMRAEVDGYSATYDEWGWLMAALYAAPGADTDVWGSVKTPQYASRADFDTKTGATYNPAGLLPLLDEGTDPFPYVAPHSSRTGRRGANRHAAQIRAWGTDYLIHAPRNSADYREFARYPAYVPASV